MTPQAALAIDSFEWENPPRTPQQRPENGEVGSGFEVNWRQWLAANRKLAIKHGLAGTSDKTAKSAPKGVRNRYRKGGRRFRR